jgi:predicted Zn-dependent protease
MKWGKNSILLLVILALAASCAVNPVTGRRELNLISEQQEIAMGQQTDTEVRAEYGVYTAPALEACVSATGAALAAKAQRPNLAYHFAVLDSPVINAFAAPGGYIFVTRGLLALMTSEDELAVVVGHELGHVNARHSVKRMSEMMLAQVGLAVGSAVSPTIAKLSGAAGVGVQLLFLKFSRDDEYQADSLGVDYARRTGYDAGSMVTFFEAMQKNGDLSGGRSIPGFLSTHPLTADRIREVKGMLKPEDARLAHNPEVFLQKLDTLVFGDDPRQGYVEGTVFYHPGFRVQFAVPSGWKVENTAAMVKLTSADSNGVLYLQAEKSPDSLADYAKKKASELQNSRLLAEKNLTVNGLSCFEQSYLVTQEDQSKLRLSRSFLKKGDMVYTFSALSLEQSFSNYQATFGQTVGSFRDLTNPAYLNRQPKRLALVRADGVTALQEIFRKQGLAQSLWPQFAIMNGLEPAAVPVKGRLIKILR